jgi:predicted DCC family thiol-disulfide oxidoreductase YuxK
MNRTKRIILFDGLCNLCDFSVQFIIKNDLSAKFAFTSCQSKEGKKLQILHGVDTIGDGTVIYIRGDDVFTKSDAALEITRDLDAPWKHFYLLRFVPGPIRDFFYTVIARNRYRLLGKKSTCFIPNENLEERFL